MAAAAPRPPYFSSRVWLVIALIVLGLLGIVLFMRFFPSDIGDQRSKSIRAEIPAAGVPA